MNKRPGLDPFLEALARDYNTIVFTAAMPDYAGPVLDYIDPKGTLFHQRLYRSSCRQVRACSTPVAQSPLSPLRFLLFDGSPSAHIFQVVFLSTVRVTTFLWLFFGASLRPQWRED